MSNTILTHQIVAREIAKGLLDGNPLLKNINRAREGDFKTEYNRIKPGQSVQVLVPADPLVYSGATFAGGLGTAGNPSAPPLTEIPVTLTVGTQLHVPLQFTAIEKALKLGDYKERVLDRATAALSSQIHATMLKQLVPQVPMALGTPGSLPATSLHWTTARGRLNDMLARKEKRYAIISSDTNTQMVDTLKSMYNPQTDISEQWKDGHLGNMMGFDFYESPDLPSITNGNKVTGVTVSGGSQTGSSLLLGGVASGDTFLEGQKFTIPGVYAVHPLTQQVYPWQQQFVVTADTTATTTTVTVPIYPELKPVAANVPMATVSASPAASAALTFFGAANTSYRQNLVWQDEAFTAAFVPLPVLASCEGYTFNADGISVRVMTFGNGQYDNESTRVDVLFGTAMVRGRHASCITE